MKQHKVSMLGTGLIGDFYTMTLHGQRNRDRVQVVYSRIARSAARPSARARASPSRTTDMMEAINHPDTDVGGRGPAQLPARGGGRRGRRGRQGGARAPSPSAATPAEAKRMLEAVEKAGVFDGYLEDLVLHAQDRSRP